MISVFLPLLLLGFGTTEFEGAYVHLSATFGILWIWLTVTTLYWDFPRFLKSLTLHDRLPSFGNAQTIFQWITIVWIIAWQTFSSPGRLFWPRAYQYFPQSWPMFISICAYVFIFWAGRKAFRKEYGFLLDPDQTPNEFFRARMTMPILFFPPMLIWMIVEDALLSKTDLSGFSDLQAFILAPLFFLMLYLFSPYLFNWAWRAETMKDDSLRSRILDLAEKARTKISGVKVWETFKEPLPNAAVAGLSNRYRFVYITKYLLEIFSKDQILAVVGHELGHLRLGHVWTYLLFSLDLVFLSLLIKLELFIGYPNFAIVHESLDSAIDLVVFLGVFILFFTALTRNSERNADSFASSLVGGRIYADALQTLNEYIVQPSSKFPRWTLTHPDFQERIDASLSWKGNIAQLEKKAKLMRFGLIFLGIIFLLVAIPSGRVALQFGSASQALKTNHIENAKSLLITLPLDYQTHPQAMELWGKIAAAECRWLKTSLYAARITWGESLRSLSESEIFEHPGSPKIALYFQIMQFLLKPLDLGRVHGVSLFNEIFDCIQISFGQT